MNWESTGKKSGSFLGESREDVSSKVNHFIKNHISYMRTIWGKQPCFKNAIPLQRGCCRIRKSEILSICDQKIGKFKAKIEKREKAKKVVPGAIFSPGYYLNLNNNYPANFVPSGPRLYGMTHNSVLLLWFRFKLGFFCSKISVFP